MHSTGLEGNECQNCLWPCPPILLICCSAPVWVSKSSGLCLSAASPQAGCQPQPCWGARQCPAGCTRGWMASCPAGSCSSPHGEHGPCWGTQSSGHTLGHQGCLPLLLRPGGTGWPHTQLWCPHCPAPLGLPHHSPSSSCTPLTRSQTHWGPNHAALKWTQLVF